MSGRTTALRRVAAGKEAGVAFTALLVLWLARRGTFAPLTLLLLYLAAVALAGVFLGVTALVRL